MKKFLLAAIIALGVPLPGVCAPAGPPAGNYIINKSTSANMQEFNVYGGTATTNLYLQFVTPGQCLTTLSTGKIVSVPCGSGAASIAITTGSISGFTSVASSPTAVVNFDSSTFNVSLKGGATAFVTLSQNYLTTSSATATYLQNSSATATYLQNSSATATYLQNSSATATYFNKSNILPVANGGTGTSSPGLIAGTNIGSITGTWPNQTINGASTLVNSTASVVVGNCAAFSSANGVVDAGAPCGTGGGGGGSTNGTVTAAPQYSVGYYSLSGSTTTIAGSNNFQWNGTSATLLGAISVSTITASSGTIPIMNVTSIRWADGTVQVSSPPTSGSSSGGGIVSPGTFTWTNNFGISGSTLSFSTATLSGQIVFKDGTTMASTSTFAPSSGSSNYIWNSQLLQPATFYVSSGTVAGLFKASSITTTGNISASNYINTADYFYMKGNPFIWDGGLRGGTGGSSQCIGLSTCNNGSGNFNTFIGGGVALNVTSAQTDVCVGGGSCAALSSGDQNSVLGYGAGAALTSGRLNTLIGYASGDSLTNGENNTYIGHRAGERDVSGIYNTAVGANAGNDIVTGVKNTCVGNKACHDMTDASSNTVVGYGEGVSNGSTDSGVTLIGFMTSSESPGLGQINNATAIGYMARVTSSNTIQMGGSGADTARVLMSTAIVSYNLSVGSFTGAGLSTCGDSTHALAWSSTNNQFSCQAITGTGSGGSSSLETIFGTARSSPTATLRGSVDFLGSVTGSTMTISMNPRNTEITTFVSSVTVLGSGGILSPNLLISSNTVFPGATFYYNAPWQTSSGVISGNLVVFNTTQSVNGAPITITGSIINSPLTPSAISASAINGTGVWSGPAASVNGIMLGVSGTGAYLGGTSLNGIVAGGSFTGTTLGTGTVSNVSGVLGLGSASTGVTTNLAGAKFSTQVLSGSSVTASYGLYITTPTVANTAVLGSNYAIYVDSQTGVSAPSMAIFTAGAAPSYFGGTTQFQRGIAVSTLTITGLTSQSCIGTDGSGNVQAGTCGGGGASSLAVTTGSLVGFSSIASSPTAVINHSSGTFSVVLTGGATAFVDILPNKFIQNQFILQQGTTAYPQFAIVGSSNTNQTAGLDNNYSPLSVHSRVANTSGSTYNSFTQTVVAPSGASSNQATGVYSTILQGGSTNSPTSKNIALRGESSYLGTGTAGDLIGAIGFSQNILTSGNATSATGVIAQANTQTATTTVQTGLYATTLVNNGAKAGTVYGIYVASTSTTQDSLIGNHYALYIDSAITSVDQQSFGIFQVNGNNYFGGTSQFSKGIRITTGTITSITSAPLQTDSSGNIYGAQVSLSSSVVGNLPASQIAAGSLGASVIASSLAATSGNITAGANVTVTGNWPFQTVAASGGGGGGGYALQPATVTIQAAQGLSVTTVTANAFDATTTSVTVSGSSGLTVNSLTASQLVVTDANKKLSSQAVLYSTVTIQFKCSSLDKLETNFAVNTATNTASSNYLTCSFDNTTRQYVNGFFKVPDNLDTGGTITIRTFGRSSTAASSKNVGWIFEHQPLANAESNGTSYLVSVSSGLSVSATQGFNDSLSWAMSVSSSTWSANDIVNFRFSRDVGTSNNLASPYYGNFIVFDLPITAKP